MPIFIGKNRGKFFLRGQNLGGRSAQNKANCGQLYSTLGGNQGR